MAKAWDTLRSGIGVGKWETSGEAVATIHVDDFEDDGSAMLSIKGQWFYADELRELAAFCTELAEQLES